MVKELENELDKTVSKTESRSPRSSIKEMPHHIALLYMRDFSLDPLSPKNNNIRDCVRMQLPISSINYS
jgi:hypothetical protein